MAPKVGAMSHAESCRKSSEHHHNEETADG